MDRAEMIRSLRGGELAWGTRNKIADELERLAAENARLQERIGKLKDTIAETFDASEAEIERWAKAWDELEADIDGFASFAASYPGVKAFVDTMLRPALDRHKPTTDLEAPDPRKQEGS